ncbi:ATP-binding cassette domain-containing protein [Paenibacillus woosongensis]|uniref:ATP-binding cassette domain-containing protein n=1 Tax=Paenibacillus woosongensis TaxID=307580 RepID=A0A7X2Z2X2_9BACL|nr:ABC transporter ATP-binding protein [Paenibacillus woosongensis]MUG46490.1 ATP-binding cassette domain-containing protein [Paenibacillus woosongensis]
MNETLALELKDVIKKRRRRMIGPVNLQIPQGHIVALVGSNGSGKSTILHMLTRSLIPDEGEIRWFGDKSAGDLPQEIRSRIAYVSENPLVEENYQTAEQAASFRAHWYPSWDQKKFERLMTHFEVPRNERLNRMSKGERRKFEVAAALAASPKLLILDELSSGLDPFIWKDMLAELQYSMLEEDVTIIMATHVVEEVRRLADYIVLVHQGKVLGMAEKDLLYGSCYEVWVRGDLGEWTGRPELIRCDEDEQSMHKLIVRDEAFMSELQQSKDLQVLRTRALELEEVLQLWIQGHAPEHR